MGNHRKQTGNHPLRNLTAVASTGSLAVLGFTGMNPYISNPDLIYPGDQLVLDLEVNSGN